MQVITNRNVIVIVLIYFYYKIILFIINMFCIFSDSIFSVFPQIFYLKVINYTMYELYRELCKYCNPHKYLIDMCNKLTYLYFCDYFTKLGFTWIYNTHKGVFGGRWANRPPPPESLFLFLSACK